MSSELNTDINIRTGSRALLLRQKVLMEALQINLPGISGNVRLALSMCADVNTGAAELSAALLKDYAITLALIKQAHSAFFSVDKTETCSMRHIVVMLGMDNVTKIVLSCPRLPSEGIQARKFKRSLLGHLMARSVMAGFIAWNIAPVWEEDPGKMAVCAMLYSLDDIAVAAVRPGAARVLWELRHAPRNMQKLSRKMVGWKPGELGMELAKRWNLPRQVRYSIAFNGLTPYKLDPSTSVITPVTVHINRVLFYAGLKKPYAGRRQMTEWNELRNLARGREKRLEKLFKKSLLKFRDENRFMADIMWEQGMLENMLI